MYEWAHSDPVLTPVTPNSIRTLTNETLYKSAINDADLLGTTPKTPASTTPKKLKRDQECQTEEFVEQKLVSTESQTDAAETLAQEKPSNAPPPPPPPPPPPMPGLTSVPKAPPLPNIPKAPPLPPPPMPGPGPALPPPPPPPMTNGSGPPKLSGPPIPPPAPGKMLPGNAPPALPLPKEADWKTAISESRKCNVFCDVFRVFFSHFIFLLTSNFFHTVVYCFSSTHFFSTFFVSSL